MEEMKIAVYDGEGTSPTLRPAFFPLTPRFLSAKELIEGNWDSDILIIPGGRDRPYDAALRGKGNDRIRSFVERGGLYIGLCAGAYYGCAKVIFDPGYPLEVIEDRELAFFPGAAVGPAYGLGTYDYKSNRGARATLLETEKSSLHCYYNGGCTFEGDFSRCHIIARYSDLPQNPPAIISCPVGRGHAILSGPHIETTFKLLNPNDPYLSKIIPTLKESESARENLWSQLLSHSA